MSTSSYVLLVLLSVPIVLRMGAVVYFAVDEMRSIIRRPIIAYPVGVIAGLAFIVIGPALAGAYEGLSRVAGALIGSFLHWISGV
jgi:hypothetical protein